MPSSISGDTEPNSSGSVSQTPSPLNQNQERTAKNNYQIGSLVFTMQGPTGSVWKQTFSDMALWQASWTGGLGPTLQVGNLTVAGWESLDAFRSDRLSRNNNGPFNVTDISINSDGNNYFEVLYTDPWNSLLRTDVAPGEELIRVLYTFAIQLPTGLVSCTLTGGNKAVDGATVDGYAQLYAQAQTACKSITT